MKKLLLSICLVALMFNAQSQDYSISQFGASSDSTKLNTVAIQAAIDKANADGGGTVIIPKGVYLTGALFFKPKTKLKLVEGAVLKGSDNIDDYPLIPSRMEGQSLMYYAALINAYFVDGFSITGPGKIDGNGLKFWESFWAQRKINRAVTNLDVHRPRLLFIWGCNDVIIQNVKLHNSGFWTTHLYQCNNVLIENCDIRSPYKPVPAPSTDGVDIDVCKKVTIRNCYISVNDDAVVLKGGKGPDAHNRAENGIVEDILIENCSFGESHGTLTLGSESIHARNIILRNCKVESAAPLIRFKMRPDTYQVFENILVENITGRSGPLISVAPWRQFFDMGGSSEKPFGILRNITLSNINVQASRLGEIEGNLADVVSNIVLKDSKITTTNPTLKTKYPGVRVENVIVNGSTFVLK